MKPQKETTRRELLAGMGKVRPAGGAMTFRENPHGRAVSLLGYGAMRLPTIDGGHANNWAKAGYSGSSIDQKMLDAQVKYMLEQGINYFDTSPAYCRGESEACMGSPSRRTTSTTTSSMPSVTADSRRSPNATWKTGRSNGASPCVRRGASVISAFPTTAIPRRLSGASTIMANTNGTSARSR